MIDEETPKQERKSGSFLKEMPILLGVAIVVAVLVRAFLLQTFFIPSGSMEQTLDINNRVLVNKLVYDFRDPRRGEIVVFNSPESWRTAPDEKDFIKRVIGVAGDHVVCCDAQQRLMINGVSLDEPYLDKVDAPDNAAAAPEPFDVTVPAGRLWVMGDNRYHSADSLDQYQRTDKNIQAATISVKSVVGRAFVLFWPLNRWDWLTVPKSFDKIPPPSS
ncbi:MAG TPA: signal peptidase I [Rugosimonospora sp.]|nr:signal peptidase I [Rugosimonospora sp.]